MHGRNSDGARFWYNSENVSGNSDMDRNGILIEVYLLTHQQERSIHHATISNEPILTIKNTLLALLSSFIRLVNMFQFKGSKTVTGIYGECEYVQYVEVIY